MKLKTFARWGLSVALLWFGQSSLNAQTPAAKLQVQTFESSQQQVPLIELYTSEGCSSCPPADRWMSKLKKKDNLWSEFVPLSFHVDYWDYLGWSDKYASKSHSQRQRRYAAEYSERTVYTPGVRKGGEEWRSWRFFRGPELDNPRAVGKLKITVNQDRSFSAQFDAESHASLQLNVAVLGVDIVSKVARGENGGKTLAHDFVVLGISTLGGISPGEWSGDLPEVNIDAPQYALAAWITENGRLTPLQATGGYLNQE